MSEEVTIESLQADIAALRQSVANKNKEAEQLRTQLEQTKAEAETGSKYKNDLIKAKAELALAGEGVTNAAKVLKYLDMSGIEIDDEGKLAGLDDRVSAMREDMPGVFGEVKKSSSNIDQAGRNKPGPKPRLTAEQGVAKELGVRYE